MEEPGPQLSKAVVLVQGRRFGQDGQAGWKEPPEPVSLSTALQFQFLLRFAHTA